MIYVRIFVAAAIALLFGRPIEGAEPLVEKYRSSLVFLHPVAITSGGAEIALQSGSGFVISEEGYVLTSFHVIKPPDSNVQYDKVEVRGAVGSRFERQYPLEVVRSDPEADLLLLQLPWLGRAWKPLTICRDISAEVDWELVSLGFPLVSDLINQKGELKAKAGPRGLWQSSLPLNPGDSGGPVLSKDGLVLGVAKAGLEYQENPTKAHIAVAISYIIPLQHADTMLRSAGIKDHCLTNASSPLGGEETVRFAIDDTKDDHPSLAPDSRPYEHVFSAPPSKRFVSASFEGSRNNVIGPDFRIVDDGKTLKINYTLTSGPIFDRWRGWLSGNVIARVQ